MPQILGCRKIRPTGRNLATALGATYNEQTAISGGDLVIRYGNAYTPDPTTRIINKRDAVRKSSNKPVCKSALMEANIPTPKRISFNDALSGQTRFPVIVRRNNHFKGKFFYKVNTPQELRRYGPNTHYIQEMVDKIDEYRLFIMNDKIIEADLKETPPGFSSIVRNHETGCFFRWVRVSSIMPELKQAARNAIQTCGLDFGAVDCATIRTPAGTRATIFEVNSAPGLVPRKVDLFVSKIREYYQ